MEQIHYLQIIDKRPQSNFRLKCIESVKQYVRDDDIYEVVEIDHNSDPLKLIREVDTIKLSKATQIANLCYVDTDVFLAKPLYEMTFEKDKPYFGKYDYNPQKKFPDIFFFYVNGRLDYFQKHLSLDKLNPNGYSIYIEALQALKDFEYFADMSYIHSYDTMDKMVYMQKLNDAVRVIERGNLLEKSLRNQIEQMNITLETFGKIER